MLRVCNHAASMLMVSDGDVVFYTGETPVEPKMYIVCSGTLEYTPIKGQPTVLSVGMWIAEAVLWVYWTHRGHLVASSNYCRLCAIDALKFHEVVCQFEHVGFDPRLHAQRFVTDINAFTGDVTDLHTAETRSTVFFSASNDSIGPHAG